MSNWVLYPAVPTIFIVDDSTCISIMVSSCVELHQSMEMTLWTKPQPIQCVIESTNIVKPCSAIQQESLIVAQKSGNVFIKMLHLHHDGFVFTRSK
jgi:hypothetical protein